MIGPNALLEAWYAASSRDLPWRTTRDAYRIWLSEVVLQQTRVEQGRAYWERIVARYPDVRALAAAREEEVLRLWQGLGYYGRARNLLAAARAVVERYDGRFPTQYEALRTLPGVGEYTAAAVASMAGNEVCAAVDGNLVRVLARLFDVADSPHTAVGRKRIAALAREAIDPARPGRWNEAMMDFGSTVCMPRRPRCEECPLTAYCMAFGAGTVALRPAPRPPTPQRERYFHYLFPVAEGCTLLHRREGRDIWQGLYELPLSESEGPVEAERMLRTDPLFAPIVVAEGARLTALFERRPHKLSHRTIRARIYRIDLAALPPIDATVVVPLTRLDEYALPRLLTAFFGELHGH